MKILITGGKGLIGSALRKTLLLRGHEVRVLSRNPVNEFDFFWILRVKKLTSMCLLI